MTEKGLNNDYESVQSPLLSNIIHFSIETVFKIFRVNHLVGQSNNVTLVLDGKSLEFTLLPDLRKEFIDVCVSCKAVVCCRVSPSQKADMVKHVREHTKVNALK